MKVFYSLDCCCRVVVLAIILPLKVTFITYGLRPSWLLERWSLVEKSGVTHEKMQGNSYEELECFLIDNFEFALNFGVVYFVFLEYSIRLYFLCNYFNCLVIIC